jgi:multidrug efflux system membrane fusion protein
MNTTTPSGSKKKVPIVSVVATVVILAVIIGGLYFWRAANIGSQQGWQQQALPVAVTQVSETLLQRRIEAVGDIRSAREVHLRAEAGGRVTSIPFESGQSVTSGALLAQLFDESEQAQLLANKAQLDFAKRQYERAKELVPSGAESEDVLNQREFEYERAQAERKAIQAQLRMKQVKAPFAGVLGIRQIDLGEYLSPGDIVVTLTDLSTLYLDFYIPQSDVAGIKTGASVTVTTDSYPQQSFNATVTAIESQVNAETRNVHVRATMDNPESKLKPGMFANVSVAEQQQDSVLMVPLTAIQSSAQGNSVIVVSGDKPLNQGTASIVPVTVGQRFAESVVVTGGLNPGDVVVANGQNRIQPDAPLKVVEQVSVEEGGDEIY